MAADIERLREYAKANSISFESLAKAAGMDLSTFYRKLKTEGENFTIGEVHRMVEAALMDRDEAILIFFPKNLHLCKN